MEPKTNRIDKDTYFMLIAKAASLRSTCRHREQGAVIVRNNRVISTGYNGSPPGQPHCIDLGFCSKERSDLCMAEGLHGESNAIVSAARAGIPIDGAIMYCLYSPCKTCCNLIVSAGVKEVRYLEVYDGCPSGPEYLGVLGIRSVKVKSSEVLSWKIRV